jgi:ATP-dependent DNA helicase RecG
MAKPKFDARKLMEQTIEVMRQSINEPRPDGKVSPYVGALLYKPDGQIETSSRGELRYGDHAEYTLLERKNRHRSLDGALLFTTLEPCAPGSRHPPKLSCAERIFLARIKEVWIGIADPDPTVDRKGIKYLQDNGVTVHMFDRDLQEVIFSENKKCFEQAEERALVADRQKSQKAVLSEFENPLPTTQLKDISDIALKQYRNIAKIKDAIGTDPFNRILIRQGLLQENNGRFIPTGFGMLLFGKEPRTTFPQAGLLATIHYADGAEETHDFDGPMVLIPQQVEKWFKDKLPNIVNRNQAQRQEIPAFPFELIREAVVNALVHRDYTIAGAKCHLIMTPDTIIIRSPGHPPPPITIVQLQSFNAPILSRNPELHYVFARMNLAEERGLGMKTLKNIPEKFNLPIPKYTYNNPYLELTFYRSPESVMRLLTDEITASLNRDELLGLNYLSTKTSITKTEYSDKMNYDDRKTQRHLKKFTELGLLRRIGAGPSTRYEVVMR